MLLGLETRDIGKHTTLCGIILKQRMILPKMSKGTMVRVLGWKTHWGLETGAREKAEPDIPGGN